MSHVITKQNAKLADKAFASDRARYYGNSVKQLVQRALEKTRESHRICDKPAADASEGSKAIARLAIVLEGRLQALEHVWEAMNGNKAMLRHWGEE